MKKMTLILLMILSVVSCNSNREAKNFVKDLEELTGVDYSIIKSSTQTEGYIVVKNDKTGEYLAYNIAKYEDISMEDYLKQAVHGVDIIHDLTQNMSTTNSPGWISNWVTYYEGDYVWVDGDSYWVDDSYYVDGDYYWDDWEDDWVWESGYWVDDGYWEQEAGSWEWDAYASSYQVDEGNYGVTTYSNTWFTGGGFTFEENSTASMDLEKVLGLEETQTKEAISNNLSAKYGLSEDRSLEIATMYTQFNQLGSMRELSEAEKKEFEVGTFGSTIEEFEDAFKDQIGGNNSKISTLVEKAAELNGLSPENTNQIISELLSSSIKE